MSKHDKILSRDLARKLREALGGSRNLLGGDAARIFAAIQAAHGWNQTDALRACGLSATCVVNWRLRPDCILRKPALARLAATIPANERAEEEERAAHGIPQKHAKWLASQGFVRHADGCWRRDDRAGVFLRYGCDRAEWELVWDFGPHASLCIRRGTPWGVWTDLICFRPAVAEWLRDRER